MRRSLKTLFLSLLLALAFSSPSQASMVVPLNINQLAAGASTIIKGKIVDLTIVEENGMFAEYVTVEVEDCIKCDDESAATFIFKQVAEGRYTMGGKVRQQKIGRPKLKVGITYVLFLPRPTETGFIAPLGLHQGVYEVQKSVDGSENLPQLKKRRSLLRKNLNLKRKPAAKARLIQRNLSTDSTDDSYSSFKQMIQAAGESANQE